MNYFQRRALRKQVKHLLHDAKHARHMREDIAPPEHIEGLRNAEERLASKWAEKDYEAVEIASSECVRAARIVYPHKSRPRVREYLEIIVVAVAVAMAFRTFFVQPFKIPTGSMEPTLYGIKATPLESRGVMDRFPLSFVSFVLFGERYTELRAPRSGIVERLIPASDDTHIMSSNGVIPPFRPGLMLHFEVGDYVQAGQVVASGRIKMGDHIFVNRVRYNFVRPKRGDVFVFSTRGMEHPDVKEDTFYIKRLAGMPGEAISLDPPYLLVDGRRVLEPAVFYRQVHHEHLGYHGYQFPRPGTSRAPFILGNAHSVLLLGEDEYFPLGDNTNHSLDGRYFGAVRQESFVGPAVQIYWPLSPRWGRIR